MFGKARKQRNLMVRTVSNVIYDQVMDFLRFQFDLKGLDLERDWELFGARDLYKLADQLAGLYFFHGYVWRLKLEFLSSIGLTPLTDRPMKGDFFDLSAQIDRSIFERMIGDTWKAGERNEIFMRYISVSSQMLSEDWADESSMENAQKHIIKGQGKALKDIKEIGDSQAHPHRLFKFLKKNINV